MPVEFTEIIDVSKKHYRKRIAHNLDDDNEQRTADVISSEFVDFQSFLLPKLLLEGIKHAGFSRPSPIQICALPPGLLGVDLVVQSKSGTGKTLVFTILALNAVNTSNKSTQVIIVAPMREIAAQIYECMRRVGVRYINKEGLSVKLFIGGTSVQADIQALKLAPSQILIGSPGRIAQLLDLQAIDIDAVRLFVLDEADKMMETSHKVHVDTLFCSMGNAKQVCVFSATYPKALDETLTNYMQSPTMVRLDTDNVQLLGIMQYVHIVQFSKNRSQESNFGDRVLELKIEALAKILKSVTFKQAIVFCNFQDKVEEVSNDLLQKHEIASEFISAARNQQQRNEAIKSLRHFNTRVLISTDLTARGIDSEHVDLVINCAVPRDAATYFHRIGRAGRFGRQGAAITICVDRYDRDIFIEMASTAKLNVKKLSHLDNDAVTTLCTNFNYWESCKKLTTLNLDQTLESENSTAPSPSNAGTDDGQMHQIYGTMSSQAYALRKIYTNVDAKSFDLILNKYSNIDTNPFISYEALQAFEEELANTQSMLPSSPIKENKCSKSAHRYSVTKMAKIYSHMVKSGRMRNHFDAIGKHPSIENDSTLKTEQTLNRIIRYETALTLGIDNEKERSLKKYTVDEIKKIGNKLNAKQQQEILARLLPTKINNYYDCFKDVLKRSQSSKTLPIAKTKNNGKKSKQKQNNTQQQSTTRQYNKSAMMRIAKTKSISQWRAMSICERGDLDVLPFVNDIRMRCPLPLQVARRRNDQQKEKENIEAEQAQYSDTLPILDRLDPSLDINLLDFYTKEFEQFLHDVDTNEQESLKTNVMFDRMPPNYHYQLNESEDVAAGNIDMQGEYFNIATRYNVELQPTMQNQLVPFKPSDMGKIKKLLSQSPTESNECTLRQRSNETNYRLVTQSAVQTDPIEVESAQCQTDFEKPPTQHDDNNMIPPYVGDYAQETFMFNFFNAYSSYIEHMIKN